MAVSLTLAKQHLRVETSDEDTLIESYLASAVAWVENHTKKKMTRGAVSQVEYESACQFSLIFGPDADAVTVGYFDSNDVEQEITDAVIVGETLFPADDWPFATKNRPITVNYTAGYVTSPADLNHAVLLLVGEYYKNREPDMASPQVTERVHDLCRPYRNLYV